MDHYTIWLTPAECQFLAYTLPSHQLWPPEEPLAAPLLREVPGGEVAGGPRLRALILAMALKRDEESLPLELTPSDLWLLDALLLRRDLRGEKLPDGEPLLSLAEKVWRSILEVYEAELPPYLRKEGTDAKPSESDQDADTDASEAIASAEALLRSGEGPGAEQDLPPAAA